MPCIPQVSVYLYPILPGPNYSGESESPYYKASYPDVIFHLRPKAWGPVRWEVTEGEGSLVNRRELVCVCERERKRQSGLVWHVLVLFRVEGRKSGKEGDRKDAEGEEVS